MDSPLSNLNPSQQTLPSKSADAIKSFLEKCAVHVMHGKTIDLGTKLQNKCVDGNTTMTEIYDKNTGLDSITINTLDGELFVFGFDNTHSDGGDLTDVGVYDENGTRIGYEVAPFLMSNGLDALSALVGLDSTKFPVASHK